MSPVGKLFIMDLSPPCRAVLLTAKAIGVDLEIVYTNLFKSEHLTPEFLKMNPAHSVPTYLDNDGTAIGDSHAIMSFLVGKYAKDDKLYPKDLSKRAVVDQRLHFDSGNVYAIHKSIVGPMYMKEATGPNKIQRNTADLMYDILQLILQIGTWVAGDCLTIADFAIVMSISAVSVVAPMDKTKHKNIFQWIKQCEALPFYDEVNKKGQDYYTQMLTDMLNNKHDFYNELTK